MVACHGEKDCSVNDCSCHDKRVGLRGCPITTPSSGSSYDSVIVDSDLLMTRYFAPNNFYVTRHRTQTLLRYLHPTEILLPARPIILAPMRTARVGLVYCGLSLMAPVETMELAFDRNHPKKAFNRIRLVSMAQEDSYELPSSPGTLFPCCTSATTRHDGGRTRDYANGCWHWLLPALCASQQLT
jgi:hypothetical protein